MRVLQVHNRYAGSLGGEDATVAQERALLEAAGHEVATHEMTNPETGSAAARTYALAPWNPAAAKRIRPVLAESEPEVVHVHNLWFALSPSVLRPIRQTGARVVMTLHNFRMVCVNAYLFRDGHQCEDCVGHLPWRGVVHRCYRDSASQSAVAAAALTVNRANRTWTRYVDTFLAHSEFAADRLSYGGIPRERTVIKRNFVPDPGPRAQSPAASNDIIYVGRLEGGKGLRDVVEAWAGRPPAGLRLTICGDGPLRPELERLAAGTATFTGWIDRDRVNELMLNARASVFPSRLFEGGNPLAVLEAYAASVPVLATDVGAGGELARAIGPEWVVPEGNREAWSAALHGLADDAVVEAGSRKARAHFEAGYTAERALETLERVYRGDPLNR